MVFGETGHFPWEIHAAEIEAEIRSFMSNVQKD